MNHLEFGIPVKYVGIGETVDDLRDFSAEEFVDAVFGSHPADASPNGLQPQAPDGHA